MDVLYEDQDIVAVDKPEGIAAIPERRPDGSSLFERLCAQRHEKLYIVHRIDKDTSGLIVFARSADAHRRLNRQFETRLVEKVYLALVHGLIRQEEGRIDSPLRQFGSGRVGVGPVRGKPSLTEFRVLQRMRKSGTGILHVSPTGVSPADMGKMQGQDGPATHGQDVHAATNRLLADAPCVFTLIEARPRTGRRHQIRVHLYSIGHPVVGDPLYGDTTGQRTYPRLMLHAHRLTLDHPPGCRLVLEAPLPESFRHVLQSLGMA